MESDWLTNQQIQKLLGNAKLLGEYIKESPLRAANAKNNFIVLIRDHRAWRLEDGSWNNSNERPAPDGTSRQMLNYFDKSSWSKLYVPQASLIQSVVWDKDVFVFQCLDRTIHATPKQVRLAVQDSITGRTLTEEEIEFNFGKLDGTSPLKYHTA